MDLASLSSCTKQCCKTSVLGLLHHEKDSRCSGSLGCLPRRKGRPMGLFFLFVFVFIYVVYGVLSVVILVASSARRSFRCNSFRPSLALADVSLVCGVSLLLLEGGF